LKVDVSPCFSTTSHQLQKPHIPACAAFLINIPVVQAILAPICDLGGDLPRAE
jgi:hypothetical protein